MRGAVYIMSNAAMPGLLKIGYTTKSAAERAAELYTTGVPSRFIVEFEVIVDNAPALERCVHDSLSASRANMDREWFRHELRDAVARVHEVLKSGVGGYVWGKRTSEACESGRHAAQPHSSLSPQPMNEWLKSWAKQRDEEPQAEKRTEPPRSSTSRIDHSPTPIRRLVSVATAALRCPQCSKSFTVTVQRHEEVGICPSCHAAAPLPHGLFT